MKTRVLIGLLSLSLAFSCQDKKASEENAAKETTEAAANSSSTIQLANYSDENWKSGVGTTFNMLLVDYSKEKFDLISQGKELNLPSGHKLPYLGCEKQGDFIQIMLNEKPETYQVELEYPNELTVE